MPKLTHNKPLCGLDINISDTYPFETTPNDPKIKYKDDQKSRILKYLPIVTTHTDRENDIDMDHQLDSSGWIIEMLMRQFGRGPEQPGLVEEFYENTDGGYYE